MKGRQREVRMPAGGKNYRPEGGIEPLRFSAPTGLKPATRTTECHLDILTQENLSVYITPVRPGQA